MEANSLTTFTKLQAPPLPRTSMFGIPQVSTRSFMQLYPIQQPTTDAVTVDIDLDIDDTEYPRLSESTKSSRSASQNLNTLKTVRLSDWELNTRQDGLSPDENSPTTAVQPTNLTDLEHSSDCPATKQPDYDIHPLLSLLFAVAVVQSSQSILSRNIATNKAEWASNLVKSVLQLSALWCTTQLSNSGRHGHLEKVCQGVTAIALVYCILCGPNTLGSNPLTSQQQTLCFVAAILATRIIHLLVTAYEAIKGRNSWIKFVQLVISTFGFAIVLALTQLSAMWMNNTLLGNPAQDVAILGTWGALALFETCIWMYYCYTTTSTSTESTIVPILSLSTLLLCKTTPLYAIIPNILVGYSSMPTRKSTFTSLVSAITLSAFTIGIVAGQLALSQLPKTPQPTPFLSETKEWNPTNIATETMRRLQSYVFASASIIALCQANPREWKKSAIYLCTSLAFILLAFFFPGIWKDWPPALSSLLILSLVHLVQQFALLFVHYKNQLAK
jgi:hypothetical protein